MTKAPSKRAKHSWRQGKNSKVLSGQGHRIQRFFFFTPKAGLPVVLPFQGASMPGLKAVFLPFFFALPAPIGLP